MRRAVALLAMLTLVTSCRGGAERPAGAEVLVVVSVPVTSSPWVAEFITRGAQLAAEQLTAAGGVRVGESRRPVRVLTLDHGDSVARAQANARRAVGDGAAALITDGVGALAVAAVTGPAKLPTFVTFEGGTSLVDEDARPTLFRMAPANSAMTMRLSDYLAGRNPRVALITDDSGYGKDGRREVIAALARNKTRLARAVEVPGGAANPAPQVLAARQSGADTVVIWARAPTVAAVIRAMRSSGWTAPVFAGPTAADPLVRQQLADHPEWVDGLTFVSFRITAEIGAEPFETFRRAYEKRFGVDEVGVVAGGRPVVMPPDWATYPYDAVRLLAAALERAGGTGAALLDACNQVSITGANGDERNFGPQNHEGVSQDDMYFATFRDMRFAPVSDDSLSRALPPVPQ